MKATPRRNVFRFILTGVGPERGRRWRPTTKRAQGGQGARTGSMLGRGTADRPSPFRRAPSAPLPHRSLPHATPTQRTTRVGVPAAPHSHTLPLLGDSGTRPTPVPRLPVSAALPLSGAGTCTPLSQVDPNSLPTSPPPHAAGDVPLSQASGGAGRLSVT